MNFISTLKIKMTGRSRFARVALVAGLVVALAGACAAPPPAPEDAFYRLSPRAESPLMATPVLKGMVEVDRFTASGSLGSRPLLFSEPGSNTVTEYRYQYWIEAPPVLLQNALVSYLRSAGVAERVASVGLKLRPDYTVRGRIMALETVEGPTSSGLVELELSLRRERDNKVLVLREYRVQMPSAAKNVKSDAAAIERAVTQVFASFVEDITKL